MIIGIDASPLIRSEYTGTEWYCYFILLSLSKLPDAEKHTWILYVPHEKFSQKLELPSNWKVKKLSWPLMSGWLRGRLTLEMLISPVDIFFAPANILPYFTPERTFTTIHDVGFVKNSELYSMKEYNTLITSFKRALKKAKTFPSHILYIDDIHRFVKTVKFFGIKSIQYKNIQKLKSDLKRINVEI